LKLEFNPFHLFNVHILDLMKFYNSLVVLSHFCVVGNICERMLTNHLKLMCFCFLHLMNVSTSIGPQLPWFSHDGPIVLMTFWNGAITTIEDMILLIENAITSIGPTQGDGLSNQWKVIGYNIWLNYKSDKVIFGNLWPWTNYWT